MASEALMETAQDILAISQGLVPVDTGALKASGGVNQINESTVEIGYGNEEVNYAKYVELGTATQAAQPYLLPSLVQAQVTFEKRLRDKMKQ